MNYFIYFTSVSFMVPEKIMKNAVCHPDQPNPIESKAEERLRFVPRLSEIFSIPFVNDMPSE